MTRPGYVRWSVATLATACLFNATPTWAQTQFPPLFPGDGSGGTGTTASDYFGEDVDISGGVAIIGARRANVPFNDTGAAYIFRLTQSGSAWVKEAKLIANDGANGDQFGTAVAIDGNTAVVGAPRDDYYILSNNVPILITDAGSAYVFEYDGTAWQQIAKLTASDAAGSDKFGTAVAIDDGVIVVGAYGDDGESGVAYVFEYNVGLEVWEETKLTARDGTENDRAAFDQFGAAVAIDGSTIVVGSRNDDDMGAAYVFTDTGSGWTSASATATKLTASERSAEDQFGFSVSVSGDTVAVGAHSYDAYFPLVTGSGRAYVYHNDGSTWTEKFVTAPLPFKASDQFGYSVAIQGDTLVVGALNDDDIADDSGSAYVFTYDGTDWDENPVTKLNALDPAAYDQLGVFVAIDDPYVIAGARGVDLDGAAYIFDLAPVTPPNEAPVAMIECPQLTNIGAEALIQFDGSGSSDREGEDLIYEWFVDGDAVSCPAGPPENCAVIEEFLTYGEHEVTLRVTDPLEATDESTKMVTINPAYLSVLDVDKAKVKFDAGPAKIDIKGEIGLPFGVDYSELDPLVSIDLRVAGANVLPVPPMPLVPVFLEAGGGQDHKWKFRDDAAALGITRLDLDWHGARFRFKGSDVELKSQIITSSESVLTFKYKIDKICGAFSLWIDGRKIAVDAEGNATTTASDVTIVEEEPHKEVTLTLDFPLLDTSSVELTGAVIATVDVPDSYDASIGRFRLRAEFDASTFDGAATLPRTLDLMLFVGAEGYSGETSLGPDDLEQKTDEWKD